MTKGHPLKGCLFYFPNFFSLIEFFYIWKYENHPRGNSLTVAWPDTPTPALASPIIPITGFPFFLKKTIKFFTGFCGNMIQ